MWVIYVTLLFDIVTSWFGLIDKFMVWRYADVVNADQSKKQK